MLTTTLNRIKFHSPCKDEWKKLLTYLGKTGADDEPLPYALIVELIGLGDALWCCRAEPGYEKEWRLFAVWCARRVQHLMKDERSVYAIDVAERYAHGKATEDELDAARYLAWDIYWDSTHNDALWAAWAATRYNAAWSAGDAIWTNDRVFPDGEKKAQKAEFLRIVG